MLIEKSPNFCMLAHGRSVEAWTVWSLPFEKKNRTPAQEDYRTRLRNALKMLEPAGGVQGSYISDEVVRADIENILFFNVGTSVFRNTATRSLQFKRVDTGVPTPPVTLDFEPHHYVRYESVANEPVIRGIKLADCAPITLNSHGLRDKAKLAARLWWLFKPAIKKTPTTEMSNGQFAVQLHIMTPTSWQANLADMLKPLMDGFISALHYYHGTQLDDIADRIAALLDEPVQDVRDRLLDEKNALLGPYRVPHLRGQGVQWSPADHLLVAGEVVREVSNDDELTIRGCAVKLIRVYNSIAGQRQESARDDNTRHPEPYGRYTADQGKAKPALMLSSSWLDSREGKIIMTTFFLYEDRPTNKITIHKATCGDCQNGKGKNEETATRRGELHFWHGPAASYVAAQAWARRLPFAAKPRVKITDCGHCHPQDYP